MQELDQAITGRWAHFSNALVREIGMTPEDAREITGFVAGAFDGDEELHDDELSPDLRSVFYTIEQNRLLSFRREEYRNEEGHIRRAFYWRIRWGEIIVEGQEPDSEAQGDPTVYDELPRTAWTRVASVG